MIKITADSICDLSPAILNEMDITLLPLIIILGDKEYRDGVNVTTDDIRKYVDEEGKACKTAALNIDEYRSFFEQFASKYEAVIHICISSGFSSCFQNASLAAQEFDNVYVIDSKNLSTGSGHVVYEAALMAREGMDAKEICKRLEQLIPRVEASFVIDRLDYLRKGGRCSGVVALGANLLQLKPCIEVVDGKMIVGKKYRGDFDKCLEKYVKDKLSERDDIDTSRIFVTHAMCSPQTVAKVKEAISKYADFDEVIETNAGCTIFCHCGPNTLGILFKRKH